MVKVIKLCNNQSKIGRINLELFNPCRKLITRLITLIKSGFDNDYFCEYVYKICFFLLKINIRLKGKIN